MSYVRSPNNTYAIPYNHCSPYLVRSNIDAAEEDKLPEEEIIAQMSYVLFIVNHVLSHDPTFRQFVYFCRNRYDL